MGEITTRPARSPSNERDLALLRKSSGRQYVFASGVELADFLISVHEHSIMACVTQDREERREGILAAIRESIASKVAEAPMLSIEYTVISLSRRGSRVKLPPTPLESVSEVIVKDAV